MTTEAVEIAIASRELRKACVHEAGHLVVLQSFGGIGHARVWSAGADRGQDETAWRGACYTNAEPGTVKFPRWHRSKFGILRAPAKWKVYLGLAGLIAEAIADGETDADDVVERISFSFFMGEVSSSDAASIGERWRLHDVRRTMALLIERWNKVCFEAGNLEKSAKFAYSEDE
mgnify:CR=1 FL=1